MDTTPRTSEIVNGTVDADANGKSELSVDPSVTDNKYLKPIQFVPASTEDPGEKPFIPAATIVQATAQHKKRARDLMVAAIDRLKAIDNHFLLNLRHAFCDEPSTVVFGYGFWNAICLAIESGVDSAPLLLGELTSTVVASGFPSTGYWLLRHDGTRFFVCWRSGVLEHWFAYEMGDEVSVSVAQEQWSSLKESQFVLITGEKMAMVKEVYRHSYNPYEHKDSEHLISRVFTPFTVPNSLKVKVAALTDYAVVEARDELLKYCYFEFVIAGILNVDVLPYSDFRHVAHYKSVTSHRSPVGTIARVCDLLGYPILETTCDWLFSELKKDAGFITLFYHHEEDGRYVPDTPPAQEHEKVYMFQTRSGYLFSSLHKTDKVYEMSTFTSRYKESYRDFKKKIKSYHEITRVALIAACTFLFWPFFGLVPAIGIAAVQMVVMNFWTKTVVTPFKKLMNGDYNQRIFFFLKWLSPLFIIVALFLVFRKLRAVKEHGKKVLLHGGRHSKTEGYGTIHQSQPSLAEPTYDRKGNPNSSFPINPSAITLTKDALDTVINTYKGIKVLNPDVRVPVWLLGVSYAVSAILSLTKVISNPFANYISDSFVHYVEVFDNFVKVNSKQLVNARYCHHGKTLTVEEDNDGKVTVRGCEKCTVARWWQKVSNWLLICFAALLVIGLGVFWYYKLRTKEKRDQLINDIQEKFKRAIGDSEAKIRELKGQLDDNYYNYKEKFYDITKELLQYMRPRDTTTFPETALLFLEQPDVWLNMYEEGTPLKQREMIQALADAKPSYDNNQWCLISDQARIWLRSPQSPPAKVLAAVFNMVVEHGKKNYNKARDNKRDAANEVREYQDNAARERAFMESNLDRYRESTQRVEEKHKIPDKEPVEFEALYPIDNGSILKTIMDFTSTKNEAKPNIAPIKTYKGVVLSKTAVDLRAWLKSISNILDYASEKDVAFIEKGYSQAWVLPHKDDLPQLNDEEYVDRIKGILEFVQSKGAGLDRIMMVVGNRGEFSKEIVVNAYTPSVVINSNRQVHDAQKRVAEKETAKPKQESEKHVKMGLVVPGFNVVQLENRSSGGVLSYWGCGLAQRSKSGGLVLYGSKHVTKNTMPLLVHNPGFVKNSQGVLTKVNSRQCVVQAYYSKENVDPAVVIIDNPFVDDTGANLQVDIPKVDFYVQPGESPRPERVAAFMFCTNKDVGQVVQKQDFQVVQFDVMINDREFGAKCQIQLASSDQKAFFKEGMSGMPVFSVEKNRFIGVYYGTIGGKPYLSLVHHINEIRTHVQQHGKAVYLEERVDNGSLHVFAESSVRMPPKKNNKFVNEHDKLRTDRVNEILDNVEVLKDFINSSESKRVTNLWKVSDITGPAKNLKKFSVFPPPLELDHECAQRADDLLFDILNTYIRGVDPNEDDNFEESFNQFWIKLKNYCLGEKKDKSAGWWGKQRNLLTKGEVFNNPTAELELKEQVHEELLNADWQITPIVYFDQKSELRDATKPPRVYAPCDLVVFAKEFYYCYKLLKSVENVPISFKKSTMSESEWEGNFDQWLYYLLEVAEVEDNLSGADFINYDGSRNAEIERRVTKILSFFFKHSRNGFLNFMKSQCATRVGIAYFKPTATDHSELLREVAKLRAEVERAKGIQTREYIEALKIRVNELIAKFHESIDTNRHPLELAWYMFVFHNGGSSGRLTTLFLNTLIHMWQLLYAWCRCLKDNGITDHQFLTEWDRFMRFLILADDRWLAVCDLVKKWSIPFDDHYFQKIAKEFGMNVEPPDGVIPITQNVFCSKYPVPIRNNGRVFYAFRISRDRLIAMINYFRRSSEHHELSVFYAKLTQFRMFLSLPVTADGNLARQTDEDVHADLRVLVDEILRQIRMYLYHLRASPSYTTEQLNEMKRQVFSIPILPYETLVMHYFPKEHGGWSSKPSAVDASGPPGNRQRQGPPNTNSSLTWEDYCALLFICFMSMVFTFMLVLVFTIISYWPTASAALIYQPILKEADNLTMKFKYHGNYGGPGYSHGHYMEEGEDYFKPKEVKAPVDLADVFYEQHDRDYANAIKGNGSERRADLALAHRLWRLGGIKNHFASFGMYLKALSGLELYGDLRKEALEKNMTNGKKNPKKLTPTEKKVVDRLARKKAASVAKKLVKPKAVAKARPIAPPKQISRPQASVQGLAPTVQNVVGRFKKPKIETGKNGATVSATTIYPMIEGESWVAGEKIIKAVLHPYALNDVFSKFADQYNYYHIKHAEIEWCTALGTNATGSLLFSAIADPGAYEQFFDVSSDDSIDIQKAALIKSQMYGANANACFTLRHGDMNLLNKGWFPTAYEGGLDATTLRQNLAGIAQVNAATNVVLSGYFVVNAVIEFKSYAYSPGSKSVRIKSVCISNGGSNPVNLLDPEYFKLSYLASNDIELPLTLGKAISAGNTPIIVNGPQVNLYDSMHVTVITTVPTTYAAQTGVKVMILDAGASPTYTNLYTLATGTSGAIGAISTMRLSATTEISYANIRDTLGFTVYVDGASVKTGNIYDWELCFFSDNDSVNLDAGWLELSPFNPRDNDQRIQIRKTSKKQAQVVNTPKVGSSASQGAEMDEEEEKAYNDFVFSQNMPSTSEEEYVSCLKAIGANESVASMYYSSGVSLETAIKLLTLSKRA